MDKASGVPRMRETISDKEVGEQKAFAWAMSDAGRRIGTYHGTCLKCDPHRDPGQKRDETRWPCHMLISDPLLALADPERCPTHASMGVMRESGDRWLAANVYSRKTRGFAFVPGGWPVPIGPTSLRHQLEIYHEQDWYGELAPLMRSPAHAPHDAYAALILGPVTPRDMSVIAPFLPRAAVTFFGLAAEREPNEDGTRMFTLSDCTFDVSGTHPDDPDALRWIKTVRQWWMHWMIGQHIRAGGRPHALSRRTVLDGWKQYEDECAVRGERASKAGFAAYLGVNRDTLSDTLSREGLEFPPR